MSYFAKWEGSKVKLERCFTRLSKKRRGKEKWFCQSVAHAQCLKIIKKSPIFTNSRKSTLKFWLFELIGENWHFYATILVIFKHCACLLPKGNKLLLFSFAKLCWFFSIFLDWDSEREMGSSINGETWNLWKLSKRLGLDSSRRSSFQSCSCVGSIIV